MAFGSNKPNTNNTNIPAAIGADGGLTCVIAEGTVITGTFTSTENVRLDGVINGNVTIDRKFVLGDKSEVIGNIKASSFAVKGKVVGDMDIADSLHIQNTADITGDMKAKTLIVEEGGRYNGKLKIGEEK
jgi:cytoskeletal protein CcmA (bactofilin family)